MSCATCRHFRRAIAGRLGYCAIHRAEGALTGDETRACWQSSEVQPEPYQGLFRDIETAAPTLQVAQMPPVPTPAVRIERAIPRGLIVAPIVPPADRGRPPKG
jgi:hypothetical protein